jgi:hypothetical protein
MRLKNFLGNIFGMLLIFVLAIHFVVATPTGISGVTPGASSRMSVSSAANISAIAGNVSEIDFSVTSVTNTWQGYYGDISGQVVLGNSANQTMYNWTAASPNGEIYATRDSGTIEWATIDCANQTELNAEDTALGVVQASASDAVNDTFISNAAFTSFYVGTTQISQGASCFATTLNDETGAPSSDFQEVLLHDGTSIIYTAVIHQDATGFDTAAHDFQMLVGEDGHDGDVDTTPYYFYVELG